MLLIFLNNILFHQIPPSRFNRYLINHSTLKVVVNRGACLALPDDRTKNLPSYGSRAEYLMGGCYAKHITEIAVYLDNNQVVVFNFNN